MKTVKTILNEFDEDLLLSELTSEKLDEYVKFLLADRDMQNTTIKKNLSFVRSFLIYCEDRKLINTDWKTYTIELKTITGKNVVFLDIHEFEKIYNFQFPPDKKCLERARDLFCFQCLTSIRYSDVAKLMKNYVVDDSIYVVGKDR